MVELTILRDNREQKPWEFANFDVELEDVTLNTGDYTLEEFCEYDPEKETYHPTYGVERKSGDDFMSSITRDMDRFQEELRRAAEWSCPLHVIVEEPKSPSRYQSDYFINFYDVDREQVFTTVDTLENNYNVSFTFAGNRGRAQRTTHSMFLSQLRSLLTSDD